MTKYNAALIVAASENDVIGVQGELPWHVSADLKRFRRLTTGHHIILGRKTFESIGRLLPERKTVIVTRNKDFYFPGAIVVDSIESALHASREDDQPFVAGGAQLYEAAMPWIQTLYLTRVHAFVDGDTWFPEIDWSRWKLAESERHAADKRNDHDYSFEIYHRA